VEATLEYTIQEVEMPLITPIIKEHRHSAKVCSCGCHNRPYDPKKRGKNDIIFGKNIQALVTYLNVKAQELYFQFFGKSSYTIQQ